MAQPAVQPDPNDPQMNSSAFVDPFYAEQAKIQLQQEYANQLRGIGGAMQQQAGTAYQTAPSGGGVGSMNVAPARGAWAAALLPELAGGILQHQIQGSQANLASKRNQALTGWLDEYAKAMSPNNYPVLRNPDGTAIKNASGGNEIDYATAQQRMNSLAGQGYQFGPVVSEHIKNLLDRGKLTQAMMPPAPPGTTQVSANPLTPPGGQPSTLGQTAPAVVQTGPSETTSIAGGQGGNLNVQPVGQGKMDMVPVPGVSGYLQNRWDPSYITKMGSNAPLSPQEVAAVTEKARRYPTLEKLNEKAGTDQYINDYVSAAGAYRNMVSASQGAGRVSDQIMYQSLLHLLNPMSRRSPSTGPIEQALTNNLLGIMHEISAKIMGGQALTPEERQQILTNSAHLVNSARIDAEGRMRPLLNLGIEAQIPEEDTRKFIYGPAAHEVSQTLQAPGGLPPVPYLPPATKGATIPPTTSGHTSSGRVLKPAPSAGPKQQGAPDDPFAPTKPRL